MADASKVKLSFGQATASGVLLVARTRVTLAPGQEWKELENAIYVRAKSIAEKNAARAEDAPTKQWLLNSSLVLAAYLELLPIAGSEVTLTILRDALTAP